MLLRYRYATVSFCNNKYIFCTSVDIPNLMHIYQFSQWTDIYLWYSSQVVPKLHIPIALSQIYVLWLDMLQYVTVCLCNNKCPLWYLSRYTESHAFLSVSASNWHIPMVFFSSGLQTAYTYSTFSNISFFWFDMLFWIIRTARAVVHWILNILKPEKFALNLRCFANSWA